VNSNTKKYQKDNLVGAVQKACDYLGGRLCEVRWAIERQSQISQHILQVLLTALDNTSRQYWEQGVKCFETAEYDIARERFNRALDANRTNYFAYQYLGLIAVHDENSQEALKNFDLARKFAENGYYRALALSHLARGHNAKGDVSQAVQSSVAATQAAPDYAKFWYETAIYQVRASGVEEAIRCLRQAISTDWMYWSISISDANLDPIRNRVERLLAECVRSNESSPVSAWTTLAPRSRLYAECRSSLRLRSGKGRWSSVRPPTASERFSHTVILFNLP